MKGQNFSSQVLSRHTFRIIRKKGSDFFYHRGTLNIDLCPVFISRKVGEDLKHKEIKPALINEQSVVYKFECGWCDASYVGYTRRHLYQRIDEHKRSGSIFNHSQSQHPSRTITPNMFHILKKCFSKFDCLLYEMFLIREHTNRV